MLRDLQLRLRAIFRRRQMDDDMRAEFAAHIAYETAKYERQGMSHQEAVRRARMAFGGMDRMAEETRDARGIGLLDTLSQDARYAWRGMRARPGFTAAIVVALGLGIGANSAMFGVVDRLLFRSPAYLAHADRVHRVFARFTWNGEQRSESGQSYLRVSELSAAPALELTAVYTERRIDVGEGEGAREQIVGIASASVFDFFDANPSLGRFFAPDEDTPPGGSAVAVLGHEFWRSAYGSRRDVLGEVVRIAGTPFTIVGVAPPGFTAFSEGQAPVAFVPVTKVASMMNGTYHQNHNWSWLAMFARRRPGFSAAAASADLTTLYQRSWDLERETGGHTSWPTAHAASAGAFVAPVHVARGPDASADSKVAVWVMGVAGIVLLIACANVANLQLARAMSRRREASLRLALGVSRRRLVQQLLTESVLLAASGAALGVLLAEWGGTILGSLFLNGAAPLSAARDGRTLVFVAAVALGIAVVTGLVPVVTARRQDLAGALRAGAHDGTYRSSRLRSALLFAQGALSVLLLVGAALFVRSLDNVRSMRLGYDVDPVLVVDPVVRSMAASERAALGARLVDLVRTTPGVRNAALAASAPFSGWESRGFPSFPGADTARIRRGQRYILQAGGPQYFATTGTRIIRGRGFTPNDRAGSLPVVVMTQAMAERLWPGEDALGRQVRFGDVTNPYLTVVGIAENVRGRRIDVADENWYFVPGEQFTAIFGGDLSTILVRVNGRAKDYIDLLRRRLQSEMPATSYVRVEPLSARVDPNQRSWEFGATMFLAFGTLALALAAIGLYSVIAYTVAQRRRELGVRMALGASAASVLRMVVGQGVVFAAVGVGIGTLVAYWAAPWLQPLLFAQPARDPLVFAMVAALLLLVATIASAGPAWRASRVDPTITLRSE